MELDVRLTAENAIVICHDDRLERTTSGRGAISKLPLAAIREFDAGSWFDRCFAGERVPILDEALVLCRELGLGANIEIKSEAGLARKPAATVAICLARHPPLPPLLISSFLADAVAESAERMPHLPRGMLWRKLPSGWAEVAERLGCATINADQRYLTPPLVARIRGAGYPLLVYTVNDAGRARQLFSWGVTSVFTDAPDIMLAAAAPEIGDGARLGARG